MPLSLLTDLSMRLFVLLNVILLGLNIYFFQYVTVVFISWTAYKRNLAKIQKTSVSSVNESEQSTYICSLSLFRTAETIFPLNLSSRTIDSRKNILPNQFVILVNFCLDRIIEKVQAGGGNYWCRLHFDML